MYTECCVFQASFYSTALKTLISVSTVILLGLIFAYHALEVQVRIMHISKYYNCNSKATVVWQQSGVITLDVEFTKFKHKDHVILILTRIKKLFHPFTRAIILAV